LAAGKRIGRPQVPPQIRDRVRANLADGHGIRSTARKFKISPASVINIRAVQVGSGANVT
jgi:DNA invertase Pin-like site-specific DNA recombinase